MIPWAQCHSPQPACCFQVLLAPVTMELKMTPHTYTVITVPQLQHDRYARQTYGDGGKMVLVCVRSRVLMQKAWLVTGCFSSHTFNYVRFGGWYDQDYTRLGRVPLETHQNFVGLHPGQANTKTTNLSGSPMTYRGHWKATSPKSLPLLIFPVWLCWEHTPWGYHIQS